LWAWLMFRPTTGPLPQISQRFAMIAVPGGLFRPVLPGEPGG